MGRHFSALPLKVLQISFMMKITKSLENNESTSNRSYGISSTECPRVHHHVVELSVFPADLITCTTFLQKLVAFEELQNKKAIDRSILLYSLDYYIVHLCPRICTGVPQIGRTK